MIQVNRIYLIFNRLVTKKFLVDTSEKIKFVKSLFRFHLIAGRAFCLGVELGSSSLLFSRELDFGRYNERLLSVF